MTDNIKKLLKKDFSYPNINDNEFQTKIYEKREFYYHKIPTQPKIDNYPDLKNYREQSCSGNFNLQSHQSLLSNFINPDTPYKGLLIFHGLGSGKTCAGVAIAENFKTLVQKYNTKIHVLVPGPLLKESWKDEIITCTKETYLKDFNIGYIDKEDKKKAMKDAKYMALQYYKIMSYRGFYKKVLGQKIIEHVSENGDVSKIYRKNDEGDFERDIAIDKIENLNNTLLIVDEAHHLTDNDYGNAVKKIIANSKNLKVLLLTATPMKNLADDIIHIINFLRPQNDQIERNFVFTSEKNHLMDFKPGGVEYFMKMTQGYISYYKGANPYLYALQKDQGIIPNGLLFTPLVQCKMNTFQNTIYQDVVQNSDDTLDRRSAAVANFVFPSYSLDTKEIIGVFGREGMNTIRNILKTNKDKLFTLLQKQFNIDESIDKNNYLLEYDKTKSLTGIIFHKDYLKYFSIKFYTCLMNILNLFEKYDNKVPSLEGIEPKGCGTAFIYSNLVKVGIELFEQVLLQNGFLEYNENGSYNITDDTRDYLTGMNYKDFKNEKINRDFYPCTYITITGGSEESGDQIPEEKKIILDSIFSNIENLQGKKIKFVLGSRVMTEGITMKQIKEIHILDTAFHLGQIMQVIGRGIRFCVHNNVASEEKPYPEVNVYRYVIQIDNGLSTEEILYQKAERKYLLVKKTERLMKEVAIDCALNYNGNIFSSEVDEYKQCITPLEYEQLNDDDKKKFKQCPITCDFKECVYECFDKKLNLKYYDTTTNFYRKLTKDKIDFSTFTNTLARNEIEYCKEVIKEMYRYKYVYLLEDFITKIKNSLSGEKYDLFEPFFAYKALDELIPISENDLNNFQDNIYDKFNVPGYLIYRSKYYIFQPFNQNEDVPMYYRNNFQNDLINELSLYQYMINIYDDKLLESLNIDNEIKIDKKIINEYKFNDVFEYYDKRDEGPYVGIIDKPVSRKKTMNEELDDIFKIRHSRDKVLKKKRATGIPSLKGAVCFSSKDKKYLIKIAKKIGLEDFLTDTRTDICNAIRMRLLYLEKYSKGNDKKTWIIIPSNHKIYNFPLNLEDNIEYTKNKIQEKIPTEIKIDIKEFKNGIFENVRNDKFTKYQLKIQNKPEWSIYSDLFIKLNFKLDKDFWIKIIE